MAKVLGLGGIFLEFKGPKEELHQWYHKHLGLDMSPYGTGFIAGEQLMVLSFKREEENLPLINFRVDHLEEMMDDLKGLGLKTKEIETVFYGKFAQFTDPFGNLIELWEPEVEPYKELVQAESSRFAEDAAAKR